MSYTVDFPVQYFPDPEKFGTVGLGKLYIGEVNGDPYLNPSDRIPVYIAQQDAVDLPITQPIDLSAGGVPIYNGSPVSIKVDLPYSVSVVNYLGSQVYYSPRGGEDIESFIDVNTRLQNLENSNVKIIDTYSDLASNFGQAGDIIKIRSHTSGNIGGGDFIALLGSVTNDGGTQINSSVPGLYWKRINYEAVTTEMFGALHNNSTDDYENLVKAINYTDANKKKLVWVAGEYMTSGELEISHKSVWEGEGVFKTIIKPTPGFSGNFVLKGVGKVNDLWLGYFGFSDMAFVNTNIVYTYQGINLKGAVWEWYMKNIRIEGFGKAGLFLDRCYRGIIENLSVYSCGLTGAEQAVILKDTSGGDRCSDIKFIGGNIQDTPAGVHAMYIEGAVNINIDTLVFQSNGRGLWLSGTTSVNLNNVYMEDLDRELFTTLKGSTPCAYTTLKNVSFARNTYTNAVLLQGDEDTVFDSCLSGTNLATITKNADSKRSQIINSPKITYASGATTGRINYVDEDFYGASLNTNMWTLAVTGTGTGAMENANGGVYRLSTGATSASTAQIVHGAFSLIYANENPVIEMRVKLNQLTNVIWRPITLENGSSYIRVYCNNGAGATNVSIDVSNAGVVTSLVAGLVINTSYHVFKIIISYNKVEFFVDGVSAGIITTNIPSASLRLTSYISNTAAANNQMDIDYIKLYKDNV